MPRKAKDKDEVIEDKKVSKSKATTKKTASKKATSKKTTVKKTATKKATPKKTTTVPKKSSTTKKTTTTKKKTTTKKAAAEKTATKKETAKKTTTASKKSSTTEKTTATKKKTTTKKTAVKKTSVKKTATKKTTAKKVTSKKSTTTKKSTTKKIAKTIKPEEYYDLPYRYDETKVKVLAQTPNILFVYWDVSDKDKQNYIKKYGDFFFNDTKPVLIVRNETMNYSFEVDINDYANSWYLHVNDSYCDYKVELGRRPINEYAQIEDYMHISSSNDMNLPNDRILFETLSNNVRFRNVKTNEIIEKDLPSYLLEKIGRFYNIKDFYKAMYKDENIDFEKLNLKNMPSS